MEWIEANPLPERCGDCDEDCWECDFALDRWIILDEDRGKIQKMMLQRAVSRLCRKLNDRNGAE